MSAPVPIGKWAWKYDKCVICKTTDYRHEGKGKCIRCYERLYFRRKYNQIIKYRDFIKGKRFKSGRELTIKKGFIKYRCEICPNHIITTPFRGGVEINISRLEMFKKEMAKQHK
jgi:hypothetical protein